MSAYLLRNIDFVHVHVHFMDRAVLVALIITRMLGKTYSFTAHAVDIYRKPILMCIKLQNARFVVTVSNFNRVHLQRIDPKLPEEKIYVLHPWVDPEKFSPPALPLYGW